MTGVKTQTFDAIIIGGGPAGAQCGLWLKLLGYNPVILEKEDTLGGLQRTNPYGNNWIVCIPSDIHIPQTMALNIERNNVACITNVTNLGIAQGASFVASFSAKNISYRLSAPKLVIATGVTYKTGNIKASTRVIIGSGNMIQEYDFKGKKVAILGGGDTAAENYFFIRDKGAQSVKIFARTLRARKNFTDKINPADLFQGKYIVNEDAVTVNEISFDVLCVMYGWQPINPLSSTITPNLNADGFFEVDNHCRTSNPNIFALGESTQRMHPCVTTSMADGVVAAKAIERDLKTSQG